MDYRGTRSKGYAGPRADSGRPLAQPADHADFRENGAGLLIDPSAEWPSPGAISSPREPISILCRPEAVQRPRFYPLPN